jgi:hypothetical protein
VPAAVWAGLYTSHFSLSCEPLDAGSYISSCCIHPAAAIKKLVWFDDLIYQITVTYFLLIYGARRLTRLTMPLPFTGTISENSILVRLEVRRRIWLFPPFVRTNIPDPVTRKRLEVALWVFILYLPTVCLRGTAKLLSHKIPRRLFHPRMIGHSI